LILDAQTIAGNLTAAGIIYTTDEGPQEVELEVLQA
jgi:hypothetical protein